MRELVFVSLEPWDHIWRRNQFICAELLRRHAELRILFVEPPKDVSHAARSGRWKAIFAPRQRTVPGEPRLALVQPLKLLPNSIRWGRLVNEWLSRRDLSVEMKRLGFSRPMLWLNPHSAVHLAGKLDTSAVIYDITDDWTAAQQSPAQRSLVKQQDEELCRRADAVVVCSEQLYQLKQPLTDRLHLVPNGVDADHYAEVLDSAKEVPGLAKTWTKPVLGYTGTVHAERVDFSLVERMATELPQATIVLAGPIHLGEAEQSRLRQYPNIVLTGPLPYRALPAYMRAFDVCITPHLVTPFTESLNPIKLWEYLAAGKPIVSTAVAGFRDYPELVRIASDAKSFIQVCRQAMHEPAALGEARRAEARKHSWSARVARIERILGEVTIQPTPACPAELACALPCS